MSQTIGYIALVVRDYDEAIAFYTGVLGFTLVEDTPVAMDKRWVLVAPRGRTSPCLLLARAATAEQQSRIGNQTGGRVFLFLHTDDFARDYHDLKARGVRFVRPPIEQNPVKSQVCSFSQKISPPLVGTQVRHSSRKGSGKGFQNTLSSTADYFART